MRLSSTSKTFLLMLSVFSLSAQAATVKKGQSIAGYLQQVSREAIQVAQRLARTPDNKSYFKATMLAWKKVEASFILDGFDEDKFSIGFYIDQFNVGKSNYQRELKEIVSGKDAVADVLYKSSLKTINAMEYLLYTQNPKKPRVRQMLAIIAQSILSRLKEIQQGYQQYHRAINTQTDKTLSLFINRLSQETYKLKEWRIVKPTRQYKEKTHFLEYQLSDNSLSAIHTIFETQLEVLSRLDFKSSKKTVNLPTNDIKKVKVLLRQGAILSKQLIKQPRQSQKIKGLYRMSDRILKLYYDNIMVKLDFIREIIDADGD